MITAETVEVEIIHEPEHWNQNCGCMIPAAWVANVYSGMSRYKWPCGDTREEAVAYVRRELPDARII